MDYIFVLLNSGLRTKASKYGILAHEPQFPPSKTQAKCGPSPGAPSPPLSGALEHLSQVVKTAWCAGGEELGLELECETGQPFKVGSAVLVFMDKAIFPIMASLFFEEHTFSVSSLPGCLQLACCPLNAGDSTRCADGTELPAPSYATGDLLQVYVLSSRKIICVPFVSLMNVM